MATTIVKAVKAKTAKAVKPKKKVDLAAYPEADVKFAEAYSTWIAGLIANARNMRVGVSKGVKLLPPAPKMVCEELAAIRREYGEVVMSLASNMMDITTTSTPVILNGVRLGQFKLHARLVYSTPYRELSLSPLADALQPKYPKADRRHHRYPHPHVSYDQLCVGQGYNAILTGLKTGRLYDAVMAMHAVIHHHDDHSAYFRLSDWGVSDRCVNCDSIMEKNAKCVACGDIFCRQCTCKCFCGSVLCDDCFDGHRNDCPNCDT